MPRRKKTEKEEKRETKVPLDVDKNVIIVGVLAFVVGLIVGVVLQPTGGTSASPEIVSQNVAGWLTGYFKAQGVNASVSINSVKEVNGLFFVDAMVTANGRTLPLQAYVSPDGTLLFPQAIDLRNVPKSASMSPPKSDRPTVELFVMSHCPFGVQMEKALIPVLRLLGDKVDFKLHFVNYAMHGEDEVRENIRQYCIQKEYGTQKLLDYLECLNTSSKDNYNDCMVKKGIDINRINACMEAVDREYNITQILQNRNLWLSGRFPIFPIDDALNQKYGVRGSPTLVINGVTVNVARNPEALKQAICSAFTTPPPECNQTLSTETPSPGFGGGTGTNSSGQCG